MRKKRKKDPASAHYDSCFTAEDLLFYKTGGLTPEKRALIFHHLNVDKCPRCLDLYFLVEQPQPVPDSPPDRKSIISRLKKATPSRKSCPTPDTIQRGQIWTTSPQPKNSSGEIIMEPVLAIPVLVISSNLVPTRESHIIRVMPLSFDVDFHIPVETVLLDGTNPLQYPVLVEIFNEQPMLSNNLEEFRGELDPENLKQVLAARNRFLQSGPPASDAEFLSWKEKEIERASYLSLPANEHIWQDTGDEDNIKEVFLKQYKKAADSHGIRLKDLSSHVIEQNGQFTLAVVQIRDMVVLRLALHTRIPPESIDVTKDGAKLTLDEKAPDLYEGHMGYVETLPATVRVQGHIGSVPIDLHIQFIMEQ